MADVFRARTGGLSSMVKVGIAVLAVLVGTCVIGSASCTRVDTGHVGIRVKLAGSQRGVQDIPVVTGWVAYNPLTEQIIQFPVSMQTAVWTHSEHEGGANDESITFASREGLIINADVALSFHIDPARAPRFYTEFRQADISQITETYVRNQVRDALNDVASQMDVRNIAGAGKTQLLRQAQEQLRVELEPFGFVIDHLTFNSALRLPDNVVQAINRTIEADQNAAQARNQVARVQAEADQAIAQAHGEAEAARQRAQGEADALLIRARSEAQANEIIRLSTSPEVLAYRQLEHWDGHLPVYFGGTTLPMLTIDLSHLATVPEAERRARLEELLRAAAPTGAPAPGPTPPTQPTQPTPPAPTGP